MSESPPISIPDLTPRKRNLVLLAAFLGWFCAGLQMGQMNLVARSATQDFIHAGVINPASTFLWSNLGPETKTASPSLTSDQAKILLAQRAPLWLAWYNSAFLFGAAAGGLLFGRLADRYGRHPAMVSSIACYSLFAAAGYVATTPEKLLLLRFLSSMGVGGMWPVAVALASEAWGTRSRSLLAGIIGAAGNLGIVLLGIIGLAIQIAPQAWRWVMLITAAPLLLALWVAIVVPESPAWRRARLQTANSSQKTSTWEIFHPPLLSTTLIGIILGMIPLLGNWGTTAWFIPWADAVKSASHPSAKALASIMRAGGGAIGSFLGGGLATLLGRRTTYFLVSLASLTVSELTFTCLTPHSPYYSLAVFTVGLVSMIYLGWLPLYLPELFPTHVRATGAGVSFNFGRIITAFAVLGAGAIAALFRENYAATGQVTSLVYLAGMLAILFAPDTSTRKLNTNT